LRSFALNRFYTADFFSGLRDDTLVALLSPVSDRLAQSKIDLNDIPTDAKERRTFCERVAILAGDVDDGFSKEFQLDLETISKLARMEDLEDIQDAAMEHPEPSPFQTNGDPTQDELAILLWRWNPDFIRMLTAGRPPNASTFYVFQSNGPVPTYREPNQTTISAIQDGLRGWFNSHKRGDSCIVRFHEVDEDVMIVVGHGDLVKIQEILRGNQVDRDLLRPHDYDLIVFRKDTGTLQIYQNRPSKRLMKLYRQVIGRHVFGREEQFVPKLLTLAPLMTLKSAAISHGEFGQIESIRLTHLRTSKATGNKSSSTHTSDDVFDESSGDPALDAFLFGPNRVPQAAWFSISVVGMEKDLSVRVTLPQRITVSNQDFMPLVHMWLEQRRFFVMPHRNEQVAEIEPMPCASGM